MLAPLNRTLCDITTPTGTWEQVSIQIPPSRATALVSRRREAVASQAGVVENRLIDAGHWQVVFEDGTVWDVRDLPKPCGCQ